MLTTFVLPARVTGAIACVALLLGAMASAPVAAQIHPTTPTWKSVEAPAELNAPGALWIKVEGRAGHMFLAAVLRPEGPGPFPVVVLFHGAAGLRQAHLALADEVTRAGFVVVVGCWQLIASPPAGEPNPVCSEAPPQAQWQADPAANSGKELIAAARALPGVRADRVGLYGVSRGGNAALWAASTGAGVQAVVADAAAHLPPGVSPPPPSTQDVVAGLAAPTLLLHGTADRMVPVDQSREYERAARALGKPVSVVYFEGIGHPTTLAPPRAEPAPLAAARREVQPEARRRAIAFLREYLQGAGPTPVQPVGR